MSTDVPGPVGIPFTAEHLTSDSCKLNWFFPEDDGGSAITNYLIEKREAERKAWTSLSYSLSRHSAVAHNLILGKAYFFRVAAENAIGMGPFISTAAEIVIKDPISKLKYWKRCNGLEIHSNCLCFAVAKFCKLSTFYYVFFSDHVHNYVQF